MSEEFWAEFESLLKPVNTEKLEYRLYYDASSKPTHMSSHNHSDGNYVVITKEHYESLNYNCRVIDGALVFDNGDNFHIQLQKSTTGVRVVRNNANIVVEDDYTDIEYYDRNC